MKTAQIILTFAISSLTASAGMAQNSGEIKGKVFDNSGEAIYLANVYVERGGELIGTTTGIDGRFTLKPLPAGTYTVKASFVGMNAYEISGVDVGPDKITFLKDIVLEPAMLGPVVITYYKWEEPLIDPEEPTRISIVASQFRSDPTRKDPVKLASTIAPGIYRAPNSDELYFKGSRSDAMAYYVDGVKMTSLRGVPPNAISRITVYTGGLPARYGDVTGGVIAIETKSYFELYEQENARRATEEL